MPSGRKGIAQDGINTRFPVNRPPAPNNKKHPDGYLTCKLKRLLLKKDFCYEDPETKEIKKMKGADAIVFKYVLEAMQGNVQAIEGIFDRIDGKQKSDGNSNNLSVSNIIINLTSEGLISPLEREIASR